MKNLIYKINLWIYVQLIGDIPEKFFIAKLKHDYNWNKILNEILTTTT